MARPNGMMAQDDGIAIFGINFQISSMPSIPFLQTLRERTAASHQALEQNALSVNLVSAGVTEKDYSLYIQRLYGFMSGFERWVFPMLDGLVADLSARKKSAVMEANLVALGVDPVLLPVVDAEFFARLYQTTAQAMGGFYVMEGSTLGGIIINKHLQKTLGDAVFSEYFNVYGTHTGGMWKEFLAVLTNYSEKEGVREEIIVAASKTFAALEQWLVTASLQPVVR